MREVNYDATCVYEVTLLNNLGMYIGIGSTICRIMARETKEEEISQIFSKWFAHGDDSNTERIRVTLLKNVL